MSASLDRDVLRPGDSFRVAVVFDIDDGWHINGNPLGPGIGKATVVAAKGSDALEFQPARYAPAHRAEQNFGEAGKTWVWEHTGKAIHFLLGQVREDAKPGMYQLTVEGSAQVCATATCLPGKAILRIPVAITSPGTLSRAVHQELFTDFDVAQVPKGATP